MVRSHEVNAFALALSTDLINKYPRISTNSTPFMNVRASSKAPFGDRNAGAPTGPRPSPKPGHARPDKPCYFASPTGPWPGRACQLSSPARPVGPTGLQHSWRKVCEHPSTSAKKKKMLSFFSDFPEFCFSSNLSFRKKPRR